MESLQSISAKQVTEMIIILSQNKCKRKKIQFGVFHMDFSVYKMSLA